MVSGLGRGGCGIRARKGVIWTQYGERRSFLDHSHVVGATVSAGYETTADRCIRHSGTLFGFGERIINA